MPEVFVDVDLLKALINAYNPVTQSFHKKYRSILCTPNKENFVEVFGLQGPMGRKIKLEDMRPILRDINHISLTRLCYVTFQKRRRKLVI